MAATYVQTNAKSNWALERPTQAEATFVLHFVGLLCRDLLGPTKVGDKVADKVKDKGGARRVGACFDFDLRPGTGNLRPTGMTTPSAHLSPEAKASMPRHVAIIMDGNGRWAKERSLLRIEGHRAGAESARIIIRTAGELGIKYLTLYAFSVENWNRPKDEVDALMKYLVHYLKTETPELNKNNVRLEVIGQIYRLPEFVQRQLDKTMAALAHNNGLTLILALSYGGRT